MPFPTIKAKFEERFRSKSETDQVNEVSCKVLCHNVCCLIQSIYELGVEPSFWQSPPQVCIAYPLVTKYPLRPVSSLSQRNNK